jgi:hypothetical protein
MTPVKGEVKSIMDLTRCLKPGVRFVKVGSTRTQRILSTNGSVYWWVYEDQPDKPISMPLPLLKNLRIDGRYWSIKLMDEWLTWCRLDTTRAFTLSPRDSERLATWLQTATYAEVKSVEATGLVENLRFGPRTKDWYFLIWDWAASHMGGEIADTQDALWNKWGGDFVIRRIARCKRMVSERLGIDTRSWKG